MASVLMRIKFMPLVLFFSYVMSFEAAAQSANEAGVRSCNVVYVDNSAYGYRCAPFLVSMYSRDGDHILEMFWEDKERGRSFVAEPKSPDKKTARQIGEVRNIINACAEGEVCDLDDASISQHSLKEICSDDYEAFDLFVDFSFLAIRTQQARAGSAAICRGNAGVEMLLDLNSGSSPITKYYLVYSKGAAEKWLQ